jgi:hypothetical protein
MTSRKDIVKSSHEANRGEKITDPDPLGFRHSFYRLFPSASGGQKAPSLQDANPLVLYRQISLQVHVFSTLPTASTFHR